MKDLLQSVRAELALPDDRVPLLAVIVGFLIALLPIALMADGVADVVLSSAAAIFLARSIVERDFSWMREPWLMIALALWAYFVVRGLFSIDSKSAVRSLAFVRFVVFAAAVQFAVIRSPSLRRLLLYSVCVMAVFAASDAVFQYFYGVDIFGRPKEVQGTRLTGPLRNPSIGELLLYGGLPALVYFVSCVMSATAVTRDRLLAAAAVVLIYATIVLSGERMVLLMSLPTLALLILINRPSLKTIGVMAVAGLIGVVTLYVALPLARERIITTVEEISKAEQSIYSQAIMAGVDVFEDNLVFGVGLRNFKPACPHHAEGVAREACFLLHPHHAWIHLGAETGIIGATGFFTMIAFALWPAIRQWRSWPLQALMGGAALSVLLRLWPIATSGNLFSNWRATMFWLSLAAAAAMARAIAVAPAGATPKSPSTRSRRCL